MVVVAVVVGAAVVWGLSRRSKVSDRVGTHKQDTIAQPAVPMASCPAQPAQRPQRARECLRGNCRVLIQVASSRDDGAASARMQSGPVQP